MKKIEILHTLRLYDSDFITKLGLLMEREQDRYRNKNEFLTAILKTGYEAHTAATKNTSDTLAPKTGAGVQSAYTDKELYALISDMNQCIMLQLKTIALYQEIQQKLLSSIYRTMLSLAGGEKVMKANVEAGFFDDLPTRFERVILNLKKDYGL